MPVDTLPPTRPAKAPWRPQGCDGIGLILQGGGALGAYQAGVYQAMHEAGLEPDWVAGVSIGGVNGAIIAGNKPEDRLERLRAFWQKITDRRIWSFTPDGDDPRKLRNAWSSMTTTLLGQPGFFKPNVPNPWLSLRGAQTSTAFYDSSPLRETLTDLVDFDRLNSKATRYACGAVNVTSGNFIYFDNHRHEIVPEHIMASGALPPALPMVHIGTDHFWDGGLVSNTPLQHVLENIGSADMLLFQVDLFSARGPLPRDMHEVLARQKDIQYSSRTRLVTDYFARQHRQDLLIRRILDKLDDAALDAEELAEKRRLSNLAKAAIVHLIYQQAAYESQAKDYEFSATSMREHWDAGYRDTERTLRRTDWISMMPADRGIVVHDIHRAEE